MKTYQAVRAEIAKLEKQAEELRRQELRNVIAQVRQAIAEYGLTAADLGLAGAKLRGAGRGKGGKRAASRAAGAGVAKYRDPKTGQTWTGRGRPPAWIADAKNRDAFLIDAGAAPQPAARKARTAKPVVARRPAAGKARAAKSGRKAAKAVTAKVRKARAATKTGAVEIESGVAVQ